MKPLFFACILLLINTQLNASQQNQVTYTRPFADSTYDYYHAVVLKRALELTPEMGDSIAVPHPQPMPQARQFIQLKRGDGDVMWTATSDQRETLLLPVRFPLLQGLSGMRVAVINSNNQPLFPADLSLKKFKTYLGIQGQTWPDLSILQRNGFRVEGAQWSLWFHNMYTAVEKGIVDYFPRNVVEVHRDLLHHSTRHIKIEDNFLLQYPSYEFFFVSPHKPELVTRIQIGLLRMLDNGDLKAIFEQHAEHRAAMRLAKDKTRKTFKLINPMLSYEFTQPRWSENPSPMRTLLKTAIDNSTKPTLQD